jgi:hypothetical protein
MLVDDPWQFAFAFLGAIGSVATAIAVYFLYRQSAQIREQTLQTQEQTLLARQEMESTIRPWLGISEIRKNDRYEVVIDLKNYCSIPAKLTRVKELFSQIAVRPSWF